MAVSAKVVFDSRDEMFKQPVGAVREGTMVTFRLLAGRWLEVRSAELLLLFDKAGERRAITMAAAETPVQTDDYLMYTASVRMEARGLYWYAFVLHTAAGDLQVTRSAADNRAEVTAGDAPWWQQTVFRRDYEVPDWIEGGVFYHIFVDRFRHAGPYVEMEGKVTRRDWGGQPEYQPDSEGRILNRDFFGGNLAGIIEKLPYLQNLGVTCLFLSPIFEADSNHKYDTSDYLKIDPMFGSEEDLRALCEKARELGMRVILDGVFAHTGADSIYFDRYGRYGNQGAWGHPDSPYRGWYFFHPGERYETWWGIETLPRVNKGSESYRSFICGPDGVARRWLRAGASGWRLDVADELPNAFLERLAQAVKAEKPDALLLGEVWEDASNKVAYSERKNYFEGDKLDSVMNYPFRSGIIDFVRNGNAAALAGTVEAILENYPKDVVDCLMNILGTHDTERILTALGGRDLGPSPDRETQARERMNSWQRHQAVRMLKTACVVQMTLPGVPCVYYGDEAGLEGYKDPFNRACYPWGQEDRDLLDWYGRVIAFRRTHPVYRRGLYRTMAAFGGLYAFERYDDRERVITAANCGGTDEKLILSGIWKDNLTGEIYQGNVTMFPGQVLLLTPVPRKKPEGETMDYEKNYQKWLAAPQVDAETKAELQALAGRDQEIRERFTAMLDFGTAGLRGIMRAGLSGMNIYTVRYATQGLANLILGCGEDCSGGVTIAWDSRNNSETFAREAASVLTANGIHVNIFDALRPTPELSFAIRKTGSIAGINITASHNTKEYNGYKVYWADGAQLPPEHAAEVSAQLARIDLFQDVKIRDLASAEADGLVTVLGGETDEAYLSEVLKQSVAEDYVAKAADEFEIIYTPFHGTGYRLVPEVLRRIGLKHVTPVAEQMVLDGNFPTVASPNPEFVEGFKIAIDMAEKAGVDLIIGTDPDGDRCGIVVRTEDGYEALTGNQIGVLLLDFLIQVKKEEGTLAPNSAAVKSIVSTTMANAICQANGVKLFETLTGFKFIGEKIKEFEASGDWIFLFGFEESNGYLSGTYARDKDAVVASMLVAEMACWYRAKGKNLYQALRALYARYGWFREKVVSHVVEGVDGPARMAGLMADLRQTPPKEVGGLAVQRIRDYQTGLITDLATGASESTGLPESNVLFYELAEGNSVVIRPSGTEPKVKLYVMVRGASEEEAAQRLKAVTAAGSGLLSV